MGPGAVPADEAPFWGIRVLVLGQLVGFVSMPNPKLPATGGEDTTAEQVLNAFDSIFTSRRVL